MPRGDVHDSVSGLALYVQYLASRPLVHSGVLGEDAVVAYMTGFVVGAFLITPDLDMAGDKPVRPLRYWGPLAVVWWPYGRLFKHRGLSHTWVLGPLTRLAYLLLLLLAGPGWALFFLEKLGWIAWKGSPLPPALGASIFGYFVGQWLHLTLDAIYARPQGRHPKKGRGKIRVLPW